jgi:hypothetical protein
MAAYNGVYGNDDMAGLVIAGGRVVDPASGMDAVGDLAVLDGKITQPGWSWPPASLTSMPTVSRSLPTACRRSMA